MNTIDVVLVNPSNRATMYSGLDATFSAIEPPLWTGLIAAYVREKGYSVRIIDAEAEGWTAEYTAQKIFALNPLLVGVGVIGANPSASSTPKMPAASKLLIALREGNVAAKSFIYGIHPSALPERTLKEEPVDFLCRGECFDTVVKLLENLKSHTNADGFTIEGLWYKKGSQIVDGGWGRTIEDLDLLPFVAWDLLPMDKYRAHNWHCFYDNSRRTPYGVIYTSFGCPFACAFCNIHALYSGKPGIRFRSPEKVADEIGVLVEKYKVKNIKIIDEMFALKEERIASICDLIIERRYDVNIWAYSRVDTVNNEALLKKMKQAGINWLAFGIEAASAHVRDGVSKGRFDQEKIKKSITMVHKAGINVVGNYIFGLPGEDLESMQETLSLAKELNCEYANFYSAMAYPGSQLYTDMVGEGGALPETWLAYSQYSEDTVPLPTGNLSSADILRFRDRAFEEYHANPRYMKMVEEKFGAHAVSHIKEMLAHKLHRKILQ